MKEAVVAITGCRGEATSGLPVQVRIEMILTETQVRETVRTGKIPETLVDDLIVELMKLGPRKGA